MPALKPTRFNATIRWLGVVPSREASLRSEPLQSAALTFSGIPGEDHGGLTRASDSRVLDQHPRGTEIRNVRQLSIVSAEDLATIAETLGLESVAPEWLGASMVVEGLPDFTLIPPSSRLQGPDGATLVVDMENRPCNWPGKEIEAEAAGHGKAFRAAADRRRGVTAWVEREGRLTLGDTLTLHVPDQPVWPHLQSARDLP